MSLDFRTREKYKNLFITFYLIIYSFFLFMTFLSTTMFRIAFPKVVTVFLLEFTVIFIVCKMILIDKPSRGELLFYIFLSICFIGSFMHSEYGLLVINLLLILGAKNVPFKRLLLLHCAMAATLLSITVISSQVGLIENLVYTRNGNNRISFGFNYPTDFTAHIFYLVLAYCYLRKGHISYLELMGILGLSIFSFLYCGARTNAICLLLTFAIFLYLKIVNRNSNKSSSNYFCNNRLNRVLIFSMPICALSIIILTLFYHNQPNNIIMTTINSLLSGRLYLGSIGLERYGIHLFGSTFQMVGLGGTTTPPNNYFFLDSSYILILLRYGLLVFLAVMIIFVMNSFRAKRKKDITLLLILLLIAIQCMIEHHLIEIAYNPFLFLIIAKYDV